MVDKNKLPKHIAIIMDGNGRWAKARGLPRVAGHRAGIKAVREVVETCARLGIEALTLYAFSVENWRRPRREIRALMSLLEDFLAKEKDRLNQNNIRLNAIGRIEELPSSVQDRLKEICDATRQNTGLKLTLALNYGGRSEIVDAVKGIVRQVKRGRLKIEHIDEDRFSEYLYTKDLPEPDLLIRTSGEMRISNFLLWQISYSEIVVTAKLWPEFSRKDLEWAIEEFQRRERRFGGI